MATATKATARRGRADSGTTRVEPATRVVAHPAAAAETAARHNSTQLTLPVVGTVKLPPADELAYLGGVAALAVIGAIEWPIAAALGAGHLLATNRRNKILREFGEALEGERRR